MPRIHMNLSLFVLLALQPCSAFAQTRPVEGIRSNTPTVHAFINARIVQSPGKSLEKGTLVIRNGVIESVGHHDPPADARVWDLISLTIYPGLIDAYSEYGMPKPASPGSTPGNSPDSADQAAPGPRYWNDAVKADRRAVDLLTPDPPTAEKFRSAGITTALVVPRGGIFRGTSALVNLGDGPANDLVLNAEVAQHIVLGNTPASDGYPNSLMGAIALIRQTLLDAEWYRNAQAAYAAKPSLPPPETNASLDALSGFLQARRPIVMEASDERNFLRAKRIGEEFSLNLIIRGSGQEYQRLDAVAGTRVPIILPLNFPDPPAVSTPGEALEVSLSDLRYWDEAPENPARLRSAGVSLAFTSAMLKEGASLLDRVRKATGRGLSRDDALAALTIVPARLFGVGSRLGTLEPGKIANIIVTDGDLFDEKTAIRETWIGGKRYQAKPLPDIDLRGTWKVSWNLKVLPDSASLLLKGKPDSLTGTLTSMKKVSLSAVSLSASRLTFSFQGDSIGIPGLVRMAAVVVRNSLEGTGVLPDELPFVWSAVRVGPFIPEPDTAKPQEVQMASFPPVYPHGEFGRAAVPAQPEAVIVRNATVWTSGPQGVMDSADLLVQKGKVVRVGRSLEAPPGAVVIDGTGRHVTPGLIDAHSHMAVDGSVNESGQAISAEVRIGDVIDADDIGLYRALAGGLTTTHILHGSANPIGGQLQIIKLRWGLLPEQMKFENAPPTIKFALGENVKQSNWGDEYTTRYPQTRMGVEQIMRDEFRAALDYQKAHQRYRDDPSGIPPRRDLELEAVAEILDGKRFIHCHAYRQDEILAMMRVAEDFGIHVAVFQHILEGYKVADIMARHGAGASAFSDWWGYKFEVYDAIPYNGVLMHNQGVLVSFNSDSDELTRRMNLEAAKAVKYGGLSEEEALKFVTLNPAKQLKVDARIGSLETGKDADFVLWSGHPLSTYTICEQTWIDGRRYFEREEDMVLRDHITQERAVLIQKALTQSGKKKRPPAQKEKKGDSPDLHSDILQ
ncbi:MAG: amidohydrolase family protein, partial [Ignavibacteria bacterium]|nr:amidohydrolase family protein [Ignavibacteria bacterium]